MDILEEKILSREIVTVGAAAQFSGLSRSEIIELVVARDLKIFDEENGVWYNETAEGHC